jgi:hypothetical protein
MKSRTKNFLSRLRQPFNKYDKKIDISTQLNQFYGQHRSGWPYTLKILKKLHKPGGIFLDSFIERTFCWHPEGPRANAALIAYSCPPQRAFLFQFEQSNDYIFDTEYGDKASPSAGDFLHCPPTPEKIWKKAGYSY